MRILACRRSLCVLAVAAALSACDDATAPLEPIPITGTWMALTNGSVLDMLLVEEPDLSIRGTGTLRPLAVFGESVAFLAVGDAVWPEVSLLLLSQGFQDIHIRGQWIGEHAIRARMNGSGFIDQPVRLRRRP